MSLCVVKKILLVAANTAGKYPDPDVPQPSYLASTPLTNCSAPDVKVSQHICNVDVTCSWLGLHLHISFCLGWLKSNKLTELSKVL